MKLNYFNQELPDEDDRLLRKAIDEGTVPPTCLLGGPIIERSSREGLNPCGGCRGPRERCGGRPITSSTPPPQPTSSKSTYLDVQRAYNDSANARKAFRQTQTRELIKLLQA